MVPETRKHPFDVREGCARITCFTRGVKLEEYAGSEIFCAAVERQFEIIGEALRRLSQADLSAFELVPGARRIISFRNILAHGYDSVSNTMVWIFVVDFVPDLMAQTIALLESA
ncbi:MAG: HepT-like ribonuclease domain-containing protein [Thermoflexales bacterium]